MQIIQVFDSKNSYFWYTNISYRFLEYFVVGVIMKNLFFYVLLFNIVITPCIGSMGDLVEKTTQVLDICADTRKQFMQATNELVTRKLSLPNEFDQFLALIQRHETTCPFFLLAECMGNYFGDLYVGPCILSRKDHPQYRVLFESKVVESAIAKLATPESHLEYVSFGSGGCFQDLVIITKILTAKPMATITIHVIDPQYEDYVTCRTTLGYTTVVNASRLIDPHTPFFGSQQSQFNSIRGIFVMQETFRQFIASLQTHFPLAHLALYVHDSGQHYLDYITKHKMPYADIITAIDLPDNGITAAQQYAILCIEALRNKADSFNVLLKTKSIPLPPKKIGRTTRFFKEVWKVMVIQYLWLTGAIIPDFIECSEKEIGLMITLSLANIPGSQSGPAKELNSQYNFPLYIKAEQIA